MDFFLPQFTDYQTQIATTCDQILGNESKSHIYIPHYHMNSIVLSKIFLNFQNGYYLEHQRNTLECILIL